MWDLLTPEQQEKLEEKLKEKGIVPKSWKPPGKKRKEINIESSQELEELMQQRPRGR